MKDAVVDIVVYCLADRGNFFGFAGLFKINLRKHKAQGGRSIADDLFAFVPIVGLGSVLVARNACPFGKVNILCGHQDFGNHDTDIVLEFRVH